MQRGQATFYDGLSARRHDVELGLSNDRLSLEIRGDTLKAPLRWRLTDLRALSDDNASADRLILTRHMETDDETPRDPARLIVTDTDLIAAIRRSRPNLHRREVPRGTGRKIAYYAFGAVAAVAIMLFVILPAMANTLAVIIPMEREIAFGRTVMGQLERFLGAKEVGALHCDAPEGRAALDRLEARLIAGQKFDYDIEITVFDHKMLNAFAAPGGQVVLMRGLITAAESPDEVAGVLAHEIGHVVNRDSTRNALRATGSAGLLAMVLGDFSGGALVVLVGEHLINASYTREAERGADDFALKMLANANISTQGLAAFFVRLQDEFGERANSESYFASHPATGGRADLARAASENQPDTTPAMTDADWQALRSICDDGGR